MHALTMMDPSPPTAAPGTGPMLSVLRNRTYRHLFTAQVVALVGTGLATPTSPQATPTSPAPTPPPPAPGSTATTTSSTSTTPPGPADTAPPSAERAAPAVECP
ncbi:hypothetical protein ACIRYZ_25385 [Kitasatospora sp. NPDC101155]|uniref:hypothetical protein n=1 Tax=Kitasatospora sp. NPDC101155 TaxID=3364097 RepID=UPI00382B1668